MSDVSTKIAAVSDAIIGLTRRADAVDRWIGDANSSSDPWLAKQKKEWNGKIYQKLLQIYNSEGKTAAANYLQQFVTVRIEGATVKIPTPP